MMEYREVCDTCGYETNKVDRVICPRSECIGILIAKTEGKMFEVGDSVYFVSRLNSGWIRSVRYGHVKEIDNSSSCPVQVVFDGGQQDSFTKKGHYHPTREDVVLYPANSVIKITPPPKPKEEVVVEGWINIKPIESSSDIRIARVGFIYKTREDADRCAPLDRLGEAAHIKHKYKV